MLRIPEITDAAVPPRSDAEHAEPESSANGLRSRLVAQRGLFFGPSARVPEDLYSVVEKGAARRERTA